MPPTTPPAMAPTGVVGFAMGDSVMVEVVRIDVVVVEKVVVAVVLGLVDCRGTVRSAGIEVSP